MFPPSSDSDFVVYLLSCRMEKQNNGRVGALLRQPRGKRLGAAEGGQLSPLRAPSSLLSA